MTAVQDHVALAEIELCGELMIAASATEAERLSADRIDEVLKVSPGPRPPGGTPSGPRRTP
ncbi:hypothetical protein [Streptomyces kanasensis]|uniref:hypothetical protein n=1 Tax=Streptomyces kanasensis TaxID=936756 RepID=UPI0036FFAA4E